MVGTVIVVVSAYEGTRLVNVMLVVVVLLAMVMVSMLGAASTISETNMVHG